MKENSSIGSEVFWEILNSSAGLLALNGAELVLSILAFGFVAVGSIRLYKSANVAGARYIFIAMGGFVIGLLIYSGYLLLMEGESSQVADAFFAFYMSVCAAIGGYGFLRLCGALKYLEAANSPRNPTRATTARAG